MYALPRQPFDQIGAEFFGARRGYHDLRTLVLQPFDDGAVFDQHFVVVVPVQRSVAAAVLHQHAIHIDEIGAALTLYLFPFFQRSPIVVSRRFNGVENLIFFGQHIGNDV